MGKAIDIGCHDYEHGETVERNALGVYKELKEKKTKDIDQVDERLIRIVAWWHDAYKSTSLNESFSSLINEGEKSAVIFSRKAKALMTPERFNQARFAIREHNKVWRHRLRLKKAPILLRIIFEADGVETVHRARLRLVIKKKKTVTKKLITRGINFGLVVYFHLYPLTDFSKRVMRENLKT